MVDTASCLLVAFRRKNCVKVRVLPPEPVKENIYEITKEKNNLC